MRMIRLHTDPDRAGPTANSDVATSQREEEKEKRDEESRAATVPHQRRGSTVLNGRCIMRMIRLHTDPDRAEPTANRPRV